jgi:hypothetical protein
MYENIRQQTAIFIYLSLNISKTDILAKDRQWAVLGVFSYALTELGSFNRRPLFFVFHQSYTQRISNSITMNDSQKESTFSPTKMTLDITKEISQVNKNLGFIAQALNQGIISGELSLKDNENANVFRMFTRNLCAFNDQLLEITVNQPGKVCNKPIDSVEFDRNNKYSLSDSVNNSEITNDTGEAQEQSSCLWVSELADDGQEDTVPGESNDNDPVINKTHKKRKSTAKGHGLTVRKKKGKKSGSTNPKQATQISTTNVGNCNMSNSGLSDNGHELNSLQRKERCIQITWKDISSIDMVEEYIYIDTPLQLIIETTIVTSVSPNMFKVNISHIKQSN